jgi:hypothetical protein
VGESGVLVLRPRAHHLEGGGSDLRGRAGPLPAPLRRSPGREQVAERARCDGGSLT